MNKNCMTLHVEIEGKKNQYFLTPPGGLCKYPPSPSPGISAPFTGTPHGLMCTPSSTDFVLQVAALLQEIDG